MCEALGVLPYEGGLLDQEASMVIKMQTVMVVQNEKREKEIEEAKRKSGSRNKRS